MTVRRMLVVASEPTGRAGWADPPAFSLVAAFWRRVRLDLIAGDRRTRAWLETPDFRIWCGLMPGEVAPEQVKAALLEAWTRR